MTLEKFTEIIDSLKKTDEDLNKLYKLNVDLTEFVEPYQLIVSKLLREIYGDEGYDWFSWFCYERDFGEKELGAWDENNNPICYDVESLWQYLESLQNKL
jgi:hypothetical protein